MNEYYEFIIVNSLEEEWTGEEETVMAEEPTEALEDYLCDLCIRDVIDADEEKYKSIPDKVLDTLLFDISDSDVGEFDFQYDDIHYGATLLYQGKPVQNWYAIVYCEDEESEYPKYFITNTPESGYTGAEFVTCAEDALGALSDYFEGDDLAEYVLDYCLDEEDEEEELEDIERDKILVSYSEEDSSQTITYKGKSVTFYAIRVKDEDEYEQDDRHWYFDETCNWKVGMNDGWN